MIFNIFNKYFIQVRSRTENQELLARFEVSDQESFARHCLEASCIFTEVFSSCDPQSRFSAILPSVVSSEVQIKMQSIINS